jgi:hypothetical protein
MNAKKCKAIRRQLREQGFNVVCPLQRRSVMDLPSEGRQKYRKAKKAEATKPEQKIHALAKSHSHRTQDSRKHNSMKPTDRVKPWRTDTSVIMKDYSLTEDQKKVKAGLGFINHKGVFMTYKNIHAPA